MGTVTESNAPIEDDMDVASAFLALPASLQEAALMIVLAARDTRPDIAAALRDTLRELAKGDTHGMAGFLGCTANVLTCTHLARSLGQWPAYREPGGD